MGKIKGKREKEGVAEGSNFRGSHFSPNVGARRTVIFAVIVSHRVPFGLVPLLGAATCFAYTHRACRSN